MRHGTDTTDHDRRIFARLTGIVQHLHTAALPLQSLGYIGCFDLLQRFFLTTLADPVKVDFFPVP